ncbi:MAG: hypothetical protein HOP27_11350 [Anaerolineales bacterium]|nr:hypothetical protein [Anaerolineales bacterium]
MKTRILLILMLIVVGILLFSCGTNGSDQTDPVNTNALRTEAVATYASSLTETLVPAPTTSPTPNIVEPTATAPEITATLETPVTANPCYNLLYIEDVNIPDGAQMKAGEKFTKTWLVQNIGGCAWRAGFTFNHFGGDPMRGSTITLTEAIPTGAKRELSVELVVPSGVTGLIQSSWRMADENGIFFGDTLSVNITVGDTAVIATP